MTQISAIPQAARRDGTVVAVASQPSLAATAFFARDAVRVVCVLLQFGLLVYLIRRFDIERGPLGDVLVLAWLGFAVHHFLPLRLRMPFFTLLSLASIPLVIGVKYTPIVWVGGLLLIVICHLPCRLLWRLLALGVLACVLFQLRSWGKTPSVVVLASMVMFRTIIYLYDLQHRTAPFSFFRATSYFFMLPNVIFPHFPIVDYKTFTATYFNDQPLRIYQKGLRWTLRGMLHLILYRALYQFAQLDPLTITDLGGAAQFMAVTYLLYLRVSGQFHLIIGVLHLFGFNLPETHHLYLLSSSFLDLWRRVNIYWKDFILKVFFNPAYVVVKRLGPTWALVLATVYSFFWTWILHDYQWLWLRGSITFTWQNSLFWTLLGLLVLASALWEMKRSRQRALHKVQRTLRTELYRAGCTIATFVTLCLLWTMWSCQSADELWHVLSAATNVTLPSALAVAAGLTGLGVAAIFFGRSVQERSIGSLGAKKTASEFGFWPSAGLLTASALGLLLFGMIPSLPGARDTTFGEVVQSLKQDRLNELDMNAQTRGYYEKLDVTREDVSVALAIHAVAWWPSIEMTVEREDFMLREPMPNFVAKPRGKILRLNELGMRGPLYEPAKPPGVFRIALVGSSCELGRGVNDHETYGRLLEERLNREDTTERIRKFEVLNFSVEGYGAIQKLHYFRNKGLAFDPDLVLWVSARREGERTADQLANALKKGYEYPEPFATLVRGICARAGVNSSTPFRQIERRLLPYIPQLTQEVYREFGSLCRENHLRCCVVYRPEAREFLHLQEADRVAIQQMAAAAGMTFLDIKSSFDGVANRESLMVDPEGSFDWGSMRRYGVDDHPNEIAHQLLTDELYRQLHTLEYRELLTPRHASQDK